MLLKHCPGVAEAHLLLAESHHLAGDSSVALRKVADVLHRAPDTIPAHLLLTRIYHNQASPHMTCQDGAMIKHGSEKDWRTKRKQTERVIQCSANEKKCGYLKLSCSLSLYGKGVGGERAAVCAFFHLAGLSWQGHCLHVASRFWSRRPMS